MEGGLLAVDGLGKFLFVLNPASSNISMFQIDSSTDGLREVPNSPFAAVPSTNPSQAPMTPIWLATDKSRQFLFVGYRFGNLSGDGAVNVFTIDAAHLQLVQAQSVDIPSSPIGLSTDPKSLRLYVGLGPNPTTGIQGAGTQVYSIDSVLLPNASCPVSLVFTPSASGLRQASLTATDNAPGSPQSMSVSGTGVSATSAVTLLPGSISFSTITQGTVGIPRSVSVTDSGTANLNIFSATLGGANPNDFILANGCSGSIAINASCTLSVTFAPLGAGQRTASVSMSDDPPNSPQTVDLNGIASPAFTIAPAVGSSLSATVTAGQTAQFNLQATPGTGFAGTVIFACAGAPTAAACTAPPSVRLAGGNSSNFSVMVTTTGTGAIIPVSFPLRTPPSLAPISIFLAAICLLPLLLRKTQMARAFSSPVVRSFALSGAMAATLLLEIFWSAGCGGGGSSTASLVQPQPPQGTVTPSGTFALTLSFSASNAAEKQLAIPPPVQLTLTVK
jgi:hypothetical protein